MDNISDKNIKWSKEELILALAFYHKKNPLHISVTNPELLHLCQLINKVNEICYNIGLYKYPVIRTPNSVYMKLCNFLRLDPNYNGVGLSKGSKLEEEVWENFSGDSEFLFKVETSIVKIVQNYDKYTGNKRQSIKNDHENGIREGSLLFHVHKSYERAHKITVEKKSEALAKSGKLECEICGFCFEDVYGEMGKGYIECHHIIPLSRYGQEKLTKLDDLILVCANCHRMLHRYMDSVSPKELKKRLGGCNGR